MKIDSYIKYNPTTMKSSIIPIIPIILSPLKTEFYLNHSHE